MYSWLQKLQHFFFNKFRNAALTEWLVLICGSMNKNQLLDEQAAIQNSSKKSIATFLWSVVYDVMYEDFQIK